MSEHSFKVLVTNVDSKEEFELTGVENISWAKEPELESDKEKEGPGVAGALILTKVKKDLLKNDGEARYNFKVKLSDDLDEKELLFKEVKILKTVEGWSHIDLSKNVGMVFTALSVE